MDFNDEDKQHTHMTIYANKQLTPDDDQTTLGRIKVNITQTVPNDRVNRGRPQVIVRSAALNDDIGITRKCGEGSTPLFEREDVIANNVNDDESSSVYNGGFIYSSAKTGQGSSRKTSTDTSLNKRRGEHEHRGCCGKLPISRTSKKKAIGEKNNNSPAENKVPYFRDEIRERDRLSRLYGDSRRKKSRSPCANTYRSHARKTSIGKDDQRRYSPHKGTRSNCKSEQRLRKSRLDISPSKRGRSQSHHGRRTSRRSHSRTYSPHRDRSRYRNRTRSPNRESTNYSRHSRDDSHSPCCLRKRRHSTDHRSRRSHSSSNHRHRSTERKNEIENANKTEETHMHHMPSTYIPVPVPVADYAFSYPHWPIAHNPWAPPMAQRAPTDPYGYPMLPLMPPLRPMHPIRYSRPPTYMPYAPMPIAPYHPRPANRLPHIKPYVVNNQNRLRPQDKHK